MTSNETAVDRAADTLDIIAATHRYALGLDRFDPDLALSAFSEDAVWDATPVGMDRFSGHTAIRDFFERDAAAVENQYHAITNHIVNFTGDDTASGTNYVLAAGSTKQGASFRAAALNEDTYVRTADGWRILERVISPLTPPELDGLDP